jgi:hypothetical protein
MGKSSIELTLKQLIDLGIINLKKRKRKRKGRRPKKYIVDGIRSDSSGMVGYSTQLTDASKSFNPNSDAFRLRDAQEDLRVKQLEFKNIAQERFDKQIAFEDDANDFLNQYYQNLPKRQQTEQPRQQQGFSEDDGVGIMGKSATDEQFKPQINRQEQQPQLIPQQEAQVRFADIDEEPFGVAPQEIQEMEITRIPKPKNIELKQAGEELPDPVLRNVQGFGMPEVILQQAPKASPRSILKGRPSKEDILYYQSWYESLTGEDADYTILNSKKKSEIEKEIIKILLPVYKSKGGNNSIILKAKNAEIIRDAIDQL